MKTAVPMKMVENGGHYVEATSSATTIRVKNKVDSFEDEQSNAAMEICIKSESDSLEDEPTTTSTIHVILERESMDDEPTTSTRTNFVQREKNSSDEEPTTSTTTIRVERKKDSLDDEPTTTTTTTNRDDVVADVAPTTSSTNNTICMRHESDSSDDELKILATEPACVTLDSDSDGPPSTPDSPIFISVSPEYESDTEIEMGLQTPTESYFYRKLKKMTMQKKKDAAKIRALNTKWRRWKKTKAALKAKLKELKKDVNRLKQYSELATESSIAAELCNVLLFKRKRVSKNKLTQIQYPTELRKFAETVYTHSPAAYNYVRDSFEACLPHPRTLGKWQEKIIENALVENYLKSRTNATNTSEMNATTTSETNATKTSETNEIKTSEESE